MGNPVVHWELMSNDPAGVSAFYAKIFGWKVKNMPQLNYRTVETGSKDGIAALAASIAWLKERHAVALTLTLSLVRLAMTPKQGSP